MTEKEERKTAKVSEITVFETVDKEKVKSQIYEIRGLRVMLTVMWLATSV
ncbi:MAG: hypothetical protein J5928_00790 [Firmicutes bacterium]|nr:hypothetical protein [Bacillota bacterium]